jgi:hypothetical protein
MFKIIVNETQSAVSSILQESPITKTEREQITKLY